MVLMPGLVAVFIGFKLVIGSLIGLFVTALRYRSRLGFVVAVRAMVISGVVFVLVSGLAGLHAAFQNGHRINVAPWGEDLRWRNLIAENELLLCIVSSSAASCFAGFRLGKKTSL